MGLYGLHDVTLVFCVGLPKKCTQGIEEPVMETPTTNHYSREREVILLRSKTFMFWCYGGWMNIAYIDMVDPGQKN